MRTLWCTYVAHTIDDRLSSNKTNSKCFNITEWHLFVFSIIRFLLEQQRGEVKSRKTNGNREETTQLCYDFDFEYVEYCDRLVTEHGRCEMKMSHLQQCSRIIIIDSSVALFSFSTFEIVLDCIALAIVRIVIIYRFAYKILGYEIFTAVWCKHEDNSKCYNVSNICWKQKNVKS